IEEMLVEPSDLAPEALAKSSRKVAGEENGTTDESAPSASEGVLSDLEGNASSAHPVRESERLIPRTAHIRRETRETRISLALDLDGTGRAAVATGVGFFDHMLTLLARHSLIDLTVEATGDLHVDAHHTVEDVGICYGKALAQALGDKAGI